MRTSTKRFTSCNIMEVTVGTTGYCGGDAGHGGRAFIQFKDIGGSDISVITEGDKDIKVCVGGDSEIDMLGKILLWAASELQTLNEI